MDKKILQEGLDLVKGGRLYLLKQRYQEYLLLDKEYQNDVHLFQKLFIQACYYNHVNIAEWLYQEIYLKRLDVTQQIAIRHVFNYCHHRAKLKKQHKLANWVHKIQTETKTRLGIGS